MKPFSSKKTGSKSTRAGARRPAIIGLAFLAGLSLILSGCGGKPHVNPNEKVYNYINVDQPKHLDPAFVYDVYEGIVSGLLYDGLVNFGYKTDLIPGLAEKWEASDDDTSFTFHLRKNAKFSNGKPVTAADVKYSFTRVLSKDTGSDRKWVLNAIEGSDALASGTAKALSGLQAPDPYTVVIHLKSPYHAFLKKLAMPSAAIIPEGSADTDEQKRKFDRNPIGTGPWILSKWINDQRIEFTRNPHYWGKPANIDRFVYLIREQDSAQKQLFNVGQVDQYSVGFTAWDEWIKDPEKKKLLHEVPELNTYFLAFNNEKPKFKDVRVKKAISYAINRKLIFEKIQKGQGVLAEGPVPPNIDGYRPNLKGYDYNPEKAKALLAEAGVKNLSIDLWIRAEAQTDEAAAQVKSDLKAVGVTVNIIRRDLPSLREAIYNGQPDMYHYSWWLDYSDIENALIPPFHSRNIPRRGNGCRFRNAEFDKLVDAAVVEPDAKKRIAMFQKAEDIVVQQCAWIPLYHRSSYVAVQPWVKNYHPTLMLNAAKFTDLDIDLGLKNKK